MIRGRQRLNPRPPSLDFLDTMERVYRLEALESRDSVYHSKVADHLKQRANYMRALAIVGAR